MMRRLANVAFALALALGTLSGADARADAPAKPAAARLDDEGIEKDVEALYAAGKYGEALAAAQRLVALREQKYGKEHAKTGSALSDLGGMYLATGDAPKAESLLRRAVEILEASKGSDDLLATALGNLGTMLKKKGDSKGAEKLYERAVALEEKGGAARESALGTVLANLAGLYMATGRLPQAEKVFLRAITIHEKAGPERSLLNDLGSLGALYRGMGRYDKAADQFNRALPLAARVHGTNHPDVGRLHHNIAVFLTGSNQKDLAAEHYRNAEAILTRTLGPRHPDLATVYSDWALLWARSDWKQAAGLYEKALDIEEQWLESALVGGTEEDKTLYATRLETLMDRVVSFEYGGDGRGRPEVMRIALGAVLRNKARVLEASAAHVGALRERMSPEDRTLLDELARVRGAYAAAMTRGPRGMTVAEHNAETDRLRAEADVIEARIAERSAGYRRGRAKVTIEAVAARIPKDAVLMEFVRYQPRSTHFYSAASERLGRPKYMVYVLWPDGRVWHHQMSVDAFEIDRKVDIIRKGLQDPSARPHETGTQLALLHDVLFGQVGAELGPVKHVLISPDAALALVPFGALIDRENKFLITKYSFTYLSTGRDLLRLGAGGGARRSAPLLVANPDYDAPGEAGATALPDAPKGSLPTIARVKFSPLPGTAEEADALRRLLPDPSVRLERVATETALKQASSPRILHVATHGFFLGSDGKAGQGKARGLELEVPPESLPQVASEVDGRKLPVPHPMFLSGIALAGANVRKGQADDGILTAYEASSLDLTGTELVVLSACETGLGERAGSEGVRGLRRALVLAGSETQVMSLWQVDDEATRDLMTTYYQKLFREGKGRAEAMRESQLALLGRPDHSHPYYWASFIVSGAWGPLEGVTPAKNEATSAVRGAVPPGGARGCGCEVAGRNEGTRVAWGGFAALVALAVARRMRGAHARGQGEARPRWIAVAPRVSPPAPPQPGSRPPVPRPAAP
ncbi:CHAT domain-containing tetratricopeptide repeat protein [Polyangium sorediatum]|uniref:CHAT domain-containing tetratricopeptide repeat protein n=1 Tax=Polyangium sorediatum TaxID=889274 RepID=A0ABT6NJ26_9BACT|nr:CHAT domain-containing tetratricopeptide repeat protein [Polyangium sorediatum]MDI1428302.1 CHAT domain-containing tetratricopeptide repeat protein [Polyangium sorediatum]